MKFLYFLVTDCPSYNDDLGAYDFYFSNGGFTAAFLVALGVAGIAAIIYYGWCKASFSFAKIGTWIATMIVAAVASFFITGLATGYSKDPDADTGIRQAVELKYQENVDAMTMDITELDNARDNMHQALDGGIFHNNVIFRLCITNLVLTIILFYLISLLINGFSTNGVNIPHSGVYKP